MLGAPFATRARAPAARGRRSAPAEGGRPGEARALSELLLDAQQLVVLRDAVGAGGRAGLDLPAAACDGEVRDRDVLGLARAVADDRAVAIRARHLDRAQRLRERPDLVHLDEDRVRNALFD